MDVFRNIVLVACVIGIADKIISIICGDRYYSQLRLIIALIMILSIASQINGGIYMPDMTYYEEELEHAESRTREEYLDNIEENLSERVKQIYVQQGITLEKVSIAVSYDEYKYISVDEITLYTQNMEKKDEELKSIIADYFSDSEIVVVR